MKPLMWILEFAFLLLPVSLVAEASPEENHPATEYVMDAYRTVNSDASHAGSNNTEAHPIISDAKASTRQATVQGRLIEGGVECPLFQADDGKKFTLVAKPEDMKDIKVGDRVELTYSPVSRSNCMQGVTVSELKIQKVK